MARARQTIEVLNEHHYDSLQDAKERLAMLKHLIPKAKQCGVNCDEYEKMMQMANETIDQLERTWFPKGRPK